MKITIRSDSIVVEGYVNAVERNSKPLNERGVTFIERIAAGTFKRAIERAKDVRIWLNHKATKDLGGLADGNLELEEDNIGLKARAIITDPEAVEQGKRGNFVGWSFGFEDLPDGVTQLRDEETGLPLRKVTDLVLREVSLLTRDRSPAYAGTLVSVRDDGSEEERSINYSDTYESDIETIEEPVSIENREEPQEETPDPEEAPEVKEVSSEYFARYKNMIADMRKLVPEK